MAGSQRLSQRISEGDGIAVIVRVADVDTARAAEAAGAKALAVRAGVAGLRGETTLPLLWLGRDDPVDADAVAIGPEDEIDVEGGLETVVVVGDEDELETALETHDPHIFLLSPSGDEDDDDPLTGVLELLPDVPAGKLAIAELDGATRDEVLELERAGFDAVLVDHLGVGELLGGRRPDF